MPYPDASEMRPYLQSHSLALAYAYAYYLHRDTIGRAEFVVGRHAARSNSRLSRSCTAVLLANSPPFRAHAAMRQAWRCAISASFAACLISSSESGLGSPMFGEGGLGAPKPGEGG